jgi:hypothetical protein
MRQRPNRWHTHLVRGGSLMFRPTNCEGRSERRAGQGCSINTHLSRGRYARPRHSFVGVTITDPPLTRWV